ncbi:MAG: DUF6567 family protein [Myxococcota bacterium]
MNSQRRFLPMMVLVLALSGCGYNSGLLGGSVGQVEVDRANFRVVETDVRASQSTGAVLCAFPVGSSAPHADAMRKLHRKADLGPNQSLVNVRVDRAVRVYVVYCTFTTTVSADIVEFRTGDGQRASTRGRTGARVPDETNKLVRASKPSAATNPEEDGGHDADEGAASEPRVPPLPAEGPIDLQQPQRMDDMERVMAEWTEQPVAVTCDGETIRGMLLGVRSYTLVVRRHSGPLAKLFFLDCESARLDRRD